MSNFHTPVLLEEVLQYLNVQQGAWYVDCNLGGGGHTEEILNCGGKVLGIDVDAEAILEVTQRLHQYIDSGDLVLYQGNFSKLAEIVSELGIKNIKGVLFDLGLSSHQLEKTERGFSFQDNAPLDMRMDQNIGATAADLINGLYEGELADIFWQYGEERNSKRIAKRIVEERKSGEIKTTKQLADLISHLVHTREKIHPATRVFQALRIVVNDELGSLEKALPQTVEILEKDGRLVVISFHSLEDRIVKNSLKENVNLKILTDKPLTASDEEIGQNPRSRSAKLRAAEKI